MIPCAYQIGFGLLFYAGVIAMVRLAGKRLAGQLATIDLIILINLTVTLQQLAVQHGRWNPIVFLGTVFGVHLAVAAGCGRSDAFRRLIRGSPRRLVWQGRIIEEALRDERLSEEELLAGLRKLGFDSAAGVKLAVLEETGHITAVGLSDGGK